VGGSFTTNQFFIRDSVLDSVSFVAALNVWWGWGHTLSMIERSYIARSFISSPCGAPHQLVDTVVRDTDGSTAFWQFTRSWADNMTGPVFSRTTSATDTVFSRLSVADAAGTQLSPCTAAGPRGSGLTIARCNFTGAAPGGAGLALGGGVVTLDGCAVEGFDAPVRVLPTAQSGTRMAGGTIVRAGRSRLWSVANLSPVNIDVSGNWWGTANEADIRAGLYDTYSNISVGLALYRPFDAAPPAAVGPAAGWAEAVLAVDACSPGAGAGAVGGAGGAGGAGGGAPMVDWVASRLNTTVNDGAPLLWPCSPHY
jgi:hypothetical protein